MSGDDHITPPPVVWAQRSGVILLTICLEDCTKPDIKIYNDKVYFKGIGGTEKKTHEVTINLYKEIDPKKSFHCARVRNIEVILKKKEEGPFWPHLTKEKIKYHWLKIDFNKWEEEDDSADEDAVDLNKNDLISMMRQIGGLGENEQNEEEDSDSDYPDDQNDPDLPNLE